MEPSARAVTLHGALDELKTVQLLEETVGPKGLRQLRGAFGDEPSRRLLETVARSALEDLRELDDVVHEWARVAGVERKPTVAPEGLDASEVLLSIVEVLASEAEVLRRAAHRAPSDRLRERVLALAARKESAAEKLKSLV